MIVLQRPAKCPITFGLHYSLCDALLEHVLEQLCVLGIAAIENIRKVAEERGETDHNVDDHVHDHFVADRGVQAVRDFSAAIDDQQCQQAVDAVAKPMQMLDFYFQQGSRWYVHRDKPDDAAEPESDSHDFVRPVEMSCSPLDRRKTFGVFFRDAKTHVVFFVLRAGHHERLSILQHQSTVTISGFGGIKEGILYECQWCVEKESVQ